MPIPASHLMEKKFPEAEILAQSLADEISRRLAKAVSDRGMATLAVSGGRSPIRLFQLLSEAEVPWLSVVVTLVDERWVNPNDDASNDSKILKAVIVVRATRIQQGRDKGPIHLHNPMQRQEASGGAPWVLRIQCLNSAIER